MIEHYRMFAAYNAWANLRLYAVAAELDEESYRRDTGAFFGSMHGTLNHLLVADRIWMKRFTGEGDHPDRLDAILHDEFDPLRKARTEEDNRIIEWIGSLSEPALAGTFTFRTITQPREITSRLAPTLAHFFNHQTHHRGQAHMILSVLGAEPPPLDLAFFQRTDEGKHFT